MKRLVKSRARGGLTQGRTPSFARRCEATQFIDQVPGLALLAGRTRRAYVFIVELESRKSAHLEAVFLRQRRDDAVQAQVLDELSIVVGDVPHGNHGDTEFGAWPGITALDAVERVFLGERGQDTVAIVEGVLEIFDQLSFC